MKEKLISYINESFLSELLSNPNVTDISYNGDKIFYQDNILGRKKSSINITQNEASDFIRQVANLSEQQFSYSKPLLDLSVGRYRINATHGAIARVNNEKAISFSIRIASTKPRITKQSNFLTSEVLDFLTRLIESETSIIIGGRTGVGKTELQKFLLSLASDNTRIIIIDNVSELESIRANENLDVTFWEVNDDIKYADFESLIRNAVRNNPDWLVVAEARGQEMNSVVNSAMTGHPIITTIHAKELESMPERMARLTLLTNKQETYEDIIHEIRTHFPIYIYLSKKTVNKKIIRYIKAIGEFQKEGIKTIYSVKDGFNENNLSKGLRKRLGYVNEEQYE